MDRKIAMFERLVLATELFRDLTVGERLGKLVIIIFSGVFLV